MALMLDLSCPANVKACESKRVLRTQDGRLGHWERARRMRGGGTPVWALEDEEESLESCRRQGGKLQTRSNGPFFANGQGAPRGQPQRSV